ncbi:MAG TPA: ATP-binding protein [Desulfobacterales bacterium]|nr:ATP-binding protein [Desulfobacterales bacterium]
MPGRVGEGISLEVDHMKEPFLEFMKQEIPERVVLIACGLPASYKTETTEVIAVLKGLTVLRTDMIRLEVLKDEDIFDQKVASNMNKRTLVYDEMFRLAHQLAAKGIGIILDATFITQALRRRAAEVAHAHSLPFFIQQTQCPKEVSIRRISLRTKDNYQSNALTEQAYINNLKKFEPVDISDLKARFPGLPITHLLVDTTSDLTEQWYVIDKVVV